MKRLRDKVVVVTGGGRGIGKAICLAAAREGASVLVNDLGATLAGEGNDDSPANQVVAEIEAAGGRARANGEDISTFEGAAKLVDDALANFGRIDALITSAGNTITAPFTEMTEDQFDQSVNVHLKGQFACAQQAARAMVKQGNGRIVLITSHVGLYGHPMSANYASAKAGVTGLTRSAAQSLAGTGVTVNAVAPSAVTRMSDTVSVDILKQRAEALGIQLDPSMTDDQIRLAMIGAPEAVGNFITYLCSDDTEHVSGEIFAVIGNHIGRFAPWAEEEALDAMEPWTVEALAAEAPKKLLSKIAPQG